MEKRIIYFERPGGDNTSSVFPLVDDELSETGIRKVVIASTRGETAQYTMDRYKGRDIRLVIVPHQYGFGPEQRFPEELVVRARREGHEVYFGTMLFHTEELFGPGTPMWVASFLGAFCQGFKVCVEILLMASNAGLVNEGEKVIVVGGTDRGADTAMVMTGATSMNLKSLHVSQILCKPL